MNLITPTSHFDSEKHVGVLVFENDDELNSFIKKLAESPVRTSGMRIMALLPPKADPENWRVKFFLDMMEIMDGALGKDHAKIVSAAIGRIDQVLDEHSPLYRFDVTRSDLYKYRMDFKGPGKEHAHNTRTRRRLHEIADMGLSELGTAEFGVPGIMSGLYIEMVWNHTADEWDDYISYTKNLIKGLK